MDARSCNESAVSARRVASTRAGVQGGRRPYNSAPVTEEQLTDEQRAGLKFVRSMQSDRLFAYISEASVEELRRLLCMDGIGAKDVILAELDRRMTQEVNRRWNS
jgi:hypothetical protein